MLFILSTENYKTLKIIVKFMFFLRATLDVRGSLCALGLAVYPFVPRSPQQTNDSKDSTCLLGY